MTVVGQKCLYGACGLLMNGVSSNKVGNVLCSLPIFCRILKDVSYSTSLSLLIYLCRGVNSPYAVMKEDAANSLATIAEETG